MTDREVPGPLIISALAATPDRIPKMLWRIVKGGFSYLLGTLLVTSYVGALVAAAGFGIYDYGAWRIWWILAGSICGATFVLADSVFNLNLRLPLRSLLVLAGLLMALQWSAGWAPVNVPLVEVESLLLLTAAVAVVFFEFCILKPRIGRFVPMALFAAAVFAYLTYTIVDKVPVPYVDVWYQLNRAAELLIAGESPYSTLFPDFYRGTAWYGFDVPGFSYPPAVLLTSVAAHASGVDVRFVLSGMTIAAALLVARIASRAGWPNGTASLLAVSYIFTPRFGHVIVNGYSEPICGFLLALSVFLFQRGHMRLGFLIGGLFATSKQYLLVVLPMFALNTASLAQLVALGLGAVGLYLPWVFHEPGELWRAVFQVHIDRPARKDALTLSAWRINHNLRPLRRWLPIATGAGVGLLSALRFRTPTRLATNTGICLLPMMLVSPQAFGNYYTLTCWCFLIGFATDPTKDMQHRQENHLWTFMRRRLATLKQVAARRYG